MKNEEVKKKIKKNDVMALHPRHIKNWVSLFALNLRFRTETHVFKYVMNGT